MEQELRFLLITGVAVAIASFIYFVLPKSKGGKASGTLFGISFTVYGPVATFVVVWLIGLFIFKETSENGTGKTDPRVFDSLLQVATEVCVSGNLDGAVNYYEQVKNLAAEATDWELKARALMGLGQCYAHHNRYQEARTALNSARPIYIQHQNQEGEAKVLLSLGELEQKSGKNQAAIAKLDTAGRLFRRAGDSVGVAHVNLISGDIYAKTGNAVKAGELYEKVGDTTKARETYYSRPRRWFLSGVSKAVPPP